MPSTASRALLRLAFAAALLVCSRPAIATFHEIKIVQVFDGTAASPNAQYVLLQMWAGSQNFLNGRALTVFDTAGTPTQTFTFGGDVGIGANQATVLLATSQASALFNVTPDLTIPPMSIANGGKICWAGTYDCVAFGAYSGTSAGVGTPFRMGFGGLALTRRLDICLNATHLDDCDDTENSATDLFLAAPAPKNNAGTAGTTPASTCGNSIVERLEDCDDGGVASGDGCSSLCFREPSQVAPTSLAVDTTTNASDGNGVLEPGEAVLVIPSWKNTDSSPHGLTGGATDFKGPTGATYSIRLGLAGYGTLAPDAIQSCVVGSGACYQFALSAPATRPAAHWDATFDELVSLGGRKTWTLHVGDSFGDVPRSQPFYKKIETLLHNGITSGCTPATYCPGSAVPRDQMGIFLAKGIAGSGDAVPASGTVGATPYNCAAGGASIFTDVSPTDSFCKHVHYLAAQNVTAGCGGPAYCPTEPVSRLAMAGFVARAVVAPGGGAAIPETYGDAVTGLSYSCNPGSPALHFSDVQDVRGRGFGAELLRWLAARAAEDGIPRVHLDSRITAKGFYERLGFRFHTSIPCWIEVADLSTRR